MIPLLAAFFATAFVLAPDRPPAPAAAVLVCLIAAVATTAYYADTLSSAEHDHRTAAIVDSLTGLLNRGALATRFEELRLEAVRHGRLLRAPLRRRSGACRVGGTAGVRCRDAAVPEQDPVVEVGGDDLVFGVLDDRGVKKP
jgi:hypothetical protein